MAATVPAIAEPLDATAPDTASRLCELCVLCAPRICRTSERTGSRPTPTIARRSRACADSPSLQALIASGAKLLPHFDGFLLDLYALLYKMNIVLHPEHDGDAGGRHSTAFCIEELRGPRRWRSLRQQTVLDEGVAGLATLLLGEALLELLKSERVLTRGEMLDIWNLEQQARRDRRPRGGRRDRRDAARRRCAASRPKRQLDELQNRLQRENATRRAPPRRAGRSACGRTSPTARRAGSRAWRRRWSARCSDLEDVARGAEQWSLQLGGGHQSSPGAQIELGNQLGAQPEAQAHGAAGRPHAGERARAAPAARSNAPTPRCSRSALGAELSRLLPPELLSLRHPVLRRDFSRRFLDGELLVYALRAREEKGRGPMIVCLDGSSSMAGDKEIWSKAVTLTLLDIAAPRSAAASARSASPRPTRRCRCSTSTRASATRPTCIRCSRSPSTSPAAAPIFRSRSAPRSIACAAPAMRRGDIVFITDGECRVDPEWLREFKREKDKLGFSLFSVLIDVGPSSLGALKDFSDHITSVRQLTSEATREIFLKV